MSYIALQIGNNKKILKSEGGSDYDILMAILISRVYEIRIMNQAF